MTPYEVIKRKIELKKQYQDIIRRELSLVYDQIKLLQDQAEALRAVEFENKK